MKSCPSHKLGIWLPNVQGGMQWVGLRFVATTEAPVHDRIKQALVAGARGRAALQSVQVDDGFVRAGQVVGRIDDIPSCADLLQRMERACRERLAAAAALC